MNVGSFRAWIATLRHTTLEQGRQQLFPRVRAGEPVSACCLGVGTMKACAGQGVELNDVMLAYTLAPNVFFEWLGLTSESPAYSAGDVLLDWGTHLPSLRPREDTFPSHGRVSAAWLNDTAGLTFAQIADCLDYFGLHGEEETWAR